MYFLLQILDEMLILGGQLIFHVMQFLLVVQLLLPPANLFFVLLYQQVVFLLEKFSLPSYHLHFQGSHRIVLLFFVGQLVDLLL